MHIHKEAPDNHAIRSYTESQITIGDDVYQESIIVSKDIILPLWNIKSIQELDNLNIEPILTLDPEIIIIGHSQPGIFIPMTLMQYLSKKRTGIECMSIGAACRTFNVLLGEHRRVVVGIIFKQNS